VAEPHLTVIGGADHQSLPEHCLSRFAAFIEDIQNLPELSIHALHQIGVEVQVVFPQVEGNRSHQRRDLQQGVVVNPRLQILLKIFQHRWRKVERWRRLVEPRIIGVAKRLIQRRVRPGVVWVDERNNEAKRLWLRIGDPVLEKSDGIVDVASVVEGTG